jgi:lipoyl(octanoyl) transferase
MELDTQRLQIVDLGRMAYRDAWAKQQEAHDAVLAGGPPKLLLVEHPPVITFGRRGAVPEHLLAAAPRLAQLGVEVVESDRGGDVTFHGPGQIVAYPILRLNDHRYSVGAYVHKLEQRVIDTLQQFGISAYTDREAVGVWTDRSLSRYSGGGLGRGSDSNSVAKPAPYPSPRVPGEGTTSPSRIDNATTIRSNRPEKICAIGVRVKRGVTMHGIALNVETNLAYFDLIVPCGLSDRGVTSMRKVLDDNCPAIETVRGALAAQLATL